MDKSFVANFNKEILQRIHEFERDFYIVQRHKDTKCECVYHSEKGNPHCPICLGTGNQITVRKIRCAKQDSGMPDAMRPSSEIFMASTYYIDYKYHNFEVDDLIIDLEENEVEYLYQLKQERSFDSKILFIMGVAVKYKIDKDIFMNNFKAIINQGGE